MSRNEENRDAAMKKLLMRSRPWALLLLVLVAVAVVAGCLDSQGKLFSVERTKGGGGDGAAPYLAVVSIERVMRDSKAGKAGAAHLEAAKANLQKGWHELQAAAEDEPNEQRRQTLVRGLATLQRQVRAEEAAMRGLVRDVMVAEIRLYRQEHPNIMAVVSRETLLDAATELDITQAVIDSMDKREVTFPSLPEVTIQSAGAAEETGAGEGGVEMSPGSLGKGSILDKGATGTKAVPEAKAPKGRGSSPVPGAVAEPGTKGSKAAPEAGASKARDASVPGAASEPAAKKAKATHEVNEVRGKATTEPGTVSEPAAEPRAVPEAGEVGGAVPEAASEPRSGGRTGDAAAPQPASPQALPQAGERRAARPRW
jgi:Skp family chaperone for outer membrane proteins